MENGGTTNTNPQQVVPAQIPIQTPQYDDAAQTDDVMLPMPPTDQLATRYPSPLPPSPPIRGDLQGSPFERVVASQIQPVGADEEELTHYAQRPTTPVGYPSNPLAYPPQYYQGPAKHFSFPPTLPSGQNPANAPRRSVPESPPNPQRPVRNGGVSSTNPSSDVSEGSSWMPFGLILAPSFQERKVQQTFILRVLLLVLVQLLMAISISVIALAGSVQEYFEDKSWVLWTSWSLTIALVIFGLCCYNLFHRRPFDIIYLISFTSVASVGIASIVARHEAKAVVLGLFLTAVLVFGLMLTALFGKFDITNSGGLLFASLLLLVVTSFIGLFWANSVLQVTLAACGAVVFGIYLVFDIQLLMDNKKRSLEPEEYVLGTATIYLDIVNLSWHLLTTVACMRCS